jgi:hypothetical protein
MLLERVTHLVFLPDLSPQKAKALRISLAPLRPPWEKGLEDEGLKGLQISLAPLRPSWEKGLGDEGLTPLTGSLHQLLRRSLSCSGD